MISLLSCVSSSPGGCSGEGDCLPSSSLSESTEDTIMRPPCSGLAWRVDQSETSPVNHATGLLDSQQRLQTT